MVFSLQTWLAETPEIRKNAATPGYLGVGMASKFLALCVQLLIQANVCQSWAWVL